MKFHSYMINRLWNGLNHIKTRSNTRAIQAWPVLLLTNEVLGVYRNHPVCLAVRLSICLSGNLVNTTPLKPYSRFHSNCTDNTQTLCRCAWRKVMSVWLSVLFVSVIQLTLRLGSLWTHLLQNHTTDFIQNVQIRHRPYVDVHERRWCLCDCLSVRPVHQLSYTDAFCTGILVNTTPPKPYNKFHSNCSDKTKTLCRCALRKMMSVQLSVCPSCLSVVLYRWLLH